MTTVATGVAGEAVLHGPGGPTETRYFRGRDGKRLHAELFLPESPRAAVVIVHGYSEHAGRYREVANVLKGHGYAVLAFDLRGHGRSEGQRGHVTDFTEYLDDLDAAIATLDSHLDQDVPMALVAHSNGGLVALRALADPWRRPQRAKIAVLSSPFCGLKLKVSGLKTLTARVASLTLPSLSLPNALVVEHLTSDPAKQRERRLDTLCHDVASARWFTEAQFTQKWVREFAHRIEVPTLWLVAGSDEIADSSATQAIHAKLRTEAEYHELPGFQHEVFNERERARVFELLVDFLGRYFP